MKKIRVLITDDSTVIRKLVSDALGGDPAIEIVGLASNGKIALAKIPQVNPDIMTLDIEMPEMDGLTTLKEIRKTYPKLPVIMFSTLTEKGAVATINALSLGASDYVTKPANVGSVTAAIQTVRDSLIPKIKTFCRWEEPAAPQLVRRPAGLARSTATATPKLSNRVDIITIGVSTGGPNALTEVFKALPADLPVPIVIVQHMPPVFTKYLAERLDAVSPVEVREATAGEVLRAGCAWLAPGDHHLTIARSGTDVVTRLHQGPPENSCRPAVDVLFRSVAALYGPSALAVVLTGMGYDGLRGSEAIRGAGGHVVAQDEATSVVWGMPGAVAQAGLADAILPLNKVAPYLTTQTAFRPGTRPLTLAAK
jgi:two-component system, chemotaxis family, protein-glutamate methylesterase/glutaminase